MKNILVIIFLVLGSLYSNNLYSQKKTTTNKKKTAAVKNKPKSTNNSNQEYYNGHKIITGPRGGKYYINSHGKKTYI